ncbi:GNAT family N-acetyltransferase [Burkholderia gladioli]|uniref:GNAT family N-acetyltransferase n=1 Tax=Burkholderia gladioli TaxID=28095 RepID=UPI000F0B3225|nr:GNAT family N-acetyltransferase [Burkholderia gladioli]AYQ92349.1 N-acetyltransferase [Burkholderia gladioli]
MTLITRTGQLVYLRRPSLDDLDALLACRNTGLEPGSDDAMSADEAARLLDEQSLRSDSDGGWHMFAVALHGDREMIGEVGGFVHPASPPVIDIGWWIGAAWRGRGYATAAAQQLLSWCFDIRGAGSVTAHCRADNLASRRVMEKLGMRRQAGEPIDDDAPEQASYVLHARIGR